MIHNIKHLRAVAGLFDLDDVIIDILPVRVGHINDTFIVTAGGGGKDIRYTLQRINSSVFPRPDLVMENIRVVTETMQKGKVDCDGIDKYSCLRLVSTRTGGHFLVDDEGKYWRCYRYVEGVTFSRLPGDKKGGMIAAEAARAFSRFQYLLREVDSQGLHVTIEDFHNTPARFGRLLRTIEEDPFGRVVEIAGEIDFVLAREKLCGLITGPLEEGIVPTRAAHNDTKINNVVFEKEGGQPKRALCVIDLDTVMPGSALFDFGDLMRSSVCPRPEDEIDLSTISVNLPIFASLVNGWIGGAGGMLTGPEIELMVASGMVITFETGIRFLTDYLMGDTYFRVERPSHNLDRARAQFRLLLEMESKMEQMKEIVTNHYAIVC